MSLKSLARQNYVNKSLANSISPIGSGGAPVISSIIICDSSYNNLDDTALDPAGSYVKLIGTGFKTGCTVYFNNQSLTATFIGSSEVRIQTPATSVGAYNIMLFNPGNQGGAIYLNLSVSNLPTFTTAAGTLGTYYEANTAFTNTIAATGDTPLTFSLYSGTLPSGVTLSSSGVLSGTTPADAASTTYSFVVNVKDAQNQDSTRSYSLTIITDTVTWNSPSAGQAYTLIGNAAMANVTLSATSAGGYGIVYTANTLPTGVSLSGNTIYGTPTTVQTVNTLLTATANNSNRSATRSISWSVTLNDAYFNYTTLLLNGETTNTSFINDASTNSFGLTVVGDTKPVLFNPYQGDGYYSVFFNGSSDYFSISSNTAFQLGTGDFTIECWIFVNTSGVNCCFIDMRNGTTAALGPVIYQQSAGNIAFYTGGNPQITSTTTVTINQWHHVAVSRLSGSTKLFIDGVQTGSTYADTNNYIINAPRIGAYSDGTGGYMAGYISNLRVVKGTAVYTSAFTVPTAPLSPITNTSLLTCQSNRFIDKSSLNSTITTSGSPQISQSIPFTTPTSVTVNTGNSVYFNGSSYVNIASNAAFGFGTGDFTVEGWYNFTGTISTYQRPWWFGDDNDNLEINSSVLRVGGSTQGTLITGTTTIIAGVWYHIAVTRASGIYKLWLNGTQEGSSATNSYNSSARTFNLNATSAGANPVTGYTSNFRIVKGTAVYTTTFTPSTSPLTTTSQGATAGQVSLLTCQGSTITDASTNALALTMTGSPKVVNNTYPFTQTTTTVSNLNTLGSAYFDGTGDYITGPSNASLAIGTNQYTVEFWIYFTSVTATNEIFRTSTDSTSGRLAIYYNAGSLQVTATGGAGATSASFTFLANQWYHVAASRDSSNNQRLFVNGVQLATATSTNSYTQNGFTLGAGQASGFVNGYIEDLRLINGTALYTNNFAPTVSPLTAITNTSLLTLQYNGGANNYGIIDNGPFNNIITRNGNTSQGSFSPYSVTGFSNYFNGSTDYLSLPTTGNLLDWGASANYTIEAWVYPTSFIGQAGILSRRAAGGVSTDWTFYYTSSAVVLYNYGTTITATSTLTLNQWNHVALSIANGTLRIFLNGVLISTPTSISASNTNQATTYIIGQQGSTSNMIAGYLSNLRVTNSALYTTAFTPSTTPLTPIANTSALTFQSNRFIDNGPNNLALTVYGTPRIQTLSPFGSVSEATPTSYSNYFDGSGDYLTVPFNSAFNLGSDNFTIEFWVRTTSTTVYATALRLGDTWTTGSWALYLNDSGGSGIPSWWSFTLNQTLSTSGATINDGAWHHIALVRNGTTMTMYIDGTSRGTLAVSTSTVGDTSTRLWIGRDASNVRELAGYLSNIRIVKGTAVYTTNFTPPTSPLTAISGTSLLTCQSTRMIDNSTNAFTITASGDTKPSKYNPFGYTAQTYTSYTPSIHGGSYYSDGTTDYLTSPALASNIPSGDFTAELWAYPTSFAATQGLLGINNTISSGSANFGLYVETNGKITFFVAGNVTTYTTTNTVLFANQWHHVAFVRSGSNNTVYVNGVSVITNTATPSWSGTPVITVGRLFGDNTGLSFFGYLSDARVTKAAVYTSNFVPPTSPLTNYSTTIPSTLLLNMNNGGIVDAHSTTVLETVNNTQLSTSIKKYGNSSMSFNGTSQYLTTPNIVSNNYNYDLVSCDFTIEGWFYNTGAGAERYLFSQRGVGSGWEFRINATNLLQIFYTGGSTLTSTGTITGNTWTHIAATRSGTTVRIFINGVLDSSGTFSNGTTAAASYPLYVGFGTTGGGYFSGYMDDVRITKGYARYTANFTPPTQLTTR